MIVIEYHFIRDPEKALYPGIKSLSARQFEDQIEHLLKKKSLIHPEELLAYYKQHRAYPKDKFILTFDDSLKDQFTFVLPILKKYDLNGMFFILTEPLEKRELGSLEKARYCQYCISNDYHQFLLTYLEIINQLINIDNKFIRDYQANQREISQFWAEYTFYSYDERYYRFLRTNLIETEIHEKVIDQIFEDNFPDQQKLIDDHYLSWEDVISLDKSGMVIACHGHQHLYYSKYDYNTQYQDIQFSKNLIEEKLRKEIKYFSYPFGDYNEDSKRVLKNLDFSMSFTTSGKSEKDLYSIPRIDCSNYPTML
tara:strand:+ start:1524 stop:2453 length:930 start_codon:yes stop_codon:yes gene_type:complete